MPTLPQSIALNRIEETAEFFETTYNHSLKKNISAIAKKHGIGLYDSSNTPYAAFEYGRETIINALINQFFTINVSPTSKIIMTCNPHHQVLRSTHKNSNVILSSPEHYIYQLACQHPTNEIEGLWHLCHFFAFYLKSTDMHLCKDKGILFKQNGHYQFMLPVSSTFLLKVIYVIKLKSHLDPATTGSPQDGAYSFNVDTLAIDGRVSTLPTQKGELASIRLFYQNQSLDRLESLGFSSHKLRLLNRLLQHQHGLILITGSTGAGKTTTLYSLLHKLKGRHIITLEDPIEKIIPHAYQTTINQLQEYTMDTALKDILSHNPDVIAIGEIRDEKTANAVINAAYSGHLILASLHTNSIETTLLRLSNLGVSPFLISYCLRGIVSQSLQQIDQKQRLVSELFICESPPYIISDIKKELPAFLAHNQRIL